MKIEYLYDILAINRQRSIKKAADERGLSEVTLRKHIHQIEEELGDKLYINTGNTIELTDEGISFYFYAVKALGELTVYKDSFLSSSYDSELSIAVDVNIFLGYIYICSKLIGDKLNVRFDILQLYKEEILEGIRDKVHNAGVIVMDPITKEKLERYNIKYEKICTRRPVVIVSKDHPLANETEVSLGDLSKFKRIALKNSFEEYYCFEHDIEIKYGLKRSNVVFKYISDILLSLSSSNFYYIGGINEDDEILLKGLKVLNLRELKERVEVGYIYNKSTVLPAPIKEIVDVRETFKLVRA